MNHILRSLCAPLAGLVALACGDTTGLTARYETVEDTLVATAASGTSPYALSGLVLGGQNDFDPAGEPLVIRVNEGFLFDIAFDLDAAGQVLVYPYKLIVADFVGTRAARVQTTPIEYDALLAAPQSGYQDTVAVAAPVGRTVVVEARSTPYCANDLVQALYAKLVVDSVHLESREIFFRIRFDPNCGFRGLEPGIPAN